MKNLALIVFIVVLFLAIFSCERWKYRECRKVGHSAMYCLEESLDAK